jgi:hypothetical protein
MNRITLADLVSAESAKLFYRHEGDRSNPERRREEKKLPTHKTWEAV